MAGATPAYLWLADPGAPATRRRRRQATPIQGKAALAVALHLRLAHGYLLKSKSRSIARWRCLQGFITKVACAVEDGPFGVMFLTRTVYVPAGIENDVVVTSLYGSSAPGMVDSVNGSGFLFPSLSQFSIVETGTYLATRRGESAVRLLQD